MNILPIKNLTVLTNGTESIVVSGAFPMVSIFRLVGATDPVVLLGNYQISPSGTPRLNQQVIFYNESNITLGAYSVGVFGVTMPSSLATKNWVASFIWDGSAWQGGYTTYLNEDGWVETSDIADEAVTLAKVEDLTSAYLIVGNSSNRPTAVAMSGVIALTNTGVTSIVAGSIVNADVNASAAIAFSKLASLTSAYILVGSAGNVPTAVAVTGDVTISNAGVTTIAAGAVDPAMLAGDGAKDAIAIAVSAESGEQCDYAWIAPYDGTIDNIYTYVTLAVAATDDWTITANIGAVAVTNGVVTIAASSPLNTADSATPTALNAFSQGDVITFVSLKTTAGGKCQLTAHVTRT